MLSRQLYGLGRRRQVEQNGRHAPGKGAKASPAPGESEWRILDGAKTPVIPNRESNDAGFLRETMPRDLLGRQRWRRAESSEGTHF